MVRKYEIAFLIKEGEAAKGTVERINEYFAKVKADIKKENEPENRQLAYSIHKNREEFKRAYYYFVNVEMDTKSIPEFERNIKYDEGVIRHMILLED